MEQDPPGPLAEGTAITQYRDERGRRQVTRYLVAGYQPEHALTLQSAGVRPPSTIRYGVVAGSAGVTLTCSIAVETGGLLRLVASRLRRDLDRKLGETLDAFRQAMERA